jgi:hypothetical protein
MTNRGFEKRNEKKRKKFRNKTKKKNQGPRNETKRKIKETTLNETKKKCEN